MKTPSISVIMPVYNAQAYLRESIQSILNQTFVDFEFIIVNDGSTDISCEIISSFYDSRIKVINNDSNKGNYKARNIGMENAKGKYFCVMDSDDISKPNRLETQFNFLERNLEVGICGSLISFIGSDTVLDRPSSYEDIKVLYIKDNYCTHPSLMMRSSFLKKYKLRYNEEYIYSSDYDLVSRAIRVFKVVNLPDVLLEYRWHSSQISQKNESQQHFIADRIRINQLSNFNPNREEKILHLLLVSQKHIANSRQFREIQRWASYLLEKNYESGFYDSNRLVNFLRSSLKNKIILD